MVKVKDLIEYLKTYDQDMRVIWGWSEYPPDHELRNPDVEAFPIEVWEMRGITYMHFADHATIEWQKKGIAVFVDIMRNMSGWQYIKLGLRQWLKGGWYRRYRRHHYDDKYDKVYWG